MYEPRRTSKILALVLALVFFGAAFSTVLADDATSADFMTRGALTDSFGGSATSASFSSESAGQQIGGESTSSDFVMDTGEMYFDTFAPAVEDWRWYDDEEDETPTVDLAPEDVAPADVNDFDVIKLRLALRETAGIGADDVKFALEYSTSSDFSAGATAVAEIGACTATSTWCYADGAGADNSVISTALLSDSDPCSLGVGLGCGTHNTSGVSTSTFTQIKDSVTEYEFTVEANGASANTVYFFRPVNVIDGTPVPLYGTSTYPSLSTEGATLTFTIGGIATSTPAGGVTTDITTTSTNVPFGSLSLSTPVAGAQSLIVSTNASQGYEIYAYQEQGLIGETAAQIAPIDGTNASPVSWSAGCASTSTSCYGYHTSESVLSGGSTRFAADDSYAQFSSSPQEVAYSSGPATDRETDMVYKVEAHDLQAAGDYTGGVVYIVVPTF